MLCFAVGYCLWLWLIGTLGWFSENMPPFLSASLLLLPLVPVGGFDFWLRIS